MQKKLTWLSTSLFCSKNSWSYILKEGINPFLKEITESNLCRSYNIEFNYLCGENIRISLLVNDFPEILANKVDSYFKHFFKVAQLPDKEVILPVKGVFLPFPSNTIQYGLYETLEFEDNSKRLLQKNFSLLIIEALGNDVSDDEAIITFAFYLHICLIKVLRMYGLSAIDILQVYKDNSCNPKSISMTGDFAKEKYEESENILLEIFHEINQTEFLVDTPKWLQDWEDLCKINIDQTLFSTEKLLQNTHYRFVALINRNLGISGNMQLVINCFIRNVLTTNWSSELP